MRDEDTITFASQHAPPPQDVPSVRIKVGNAAAAGERSRSDILRAQTVGFHAEVFQEEEPDSGKLEIRPLRGINTKKQGEVAAKAPLPIETQAGGKRKKTCGVFF
jgi:hypothetical protein